jgi:hypothetical protein|nr:MAG TPA: hypothetical protein [Caudoviricetes sp.]
MRQENKDCVVVIYRLEVMLAMNKDYDKVIGTLQIELSGSSVIVDVCPRCLILIFRRRAISEAEMQSKIYRILEDIPYDLEKVAEL